MTATPNSDVTSISVTLTSEELEMLVDGLHALEYWDYAPELDLSRRDGQVFLPEDDPSCWQRTTVGADEENAIEQIRAIRSLASRLTDPAVR